MSLESIREQIIDNKINIKISDLGFKEMQEKLKSCCSLSEFLKIDSLKVIEAFKDFKNLEKSLNKKGAFNIDLDLSMDIERDIIETHINSFCMVVSNELVTYTNEIKTDNYFITKTEVLTHIRTCSQCE